MKQFFIILGLTALVWLGLSLGERNSYTMRTPVEMTGYDTIRYAVVQADTIVTLRVESSGYIALLRSIGVLKPMVTIDMSNRQSVAASEVCELARSQNTGISSATTEIDSLRLVLAARTKRTYKPVLDDVEFEFAEQYGLYGQPTVTPAEITLYGPEADLQRIDEVRLEPTTIEDIDASGSYRLKLQPIWEKYPDVHPSATEVTVYVPVETYVEREYKVPIQVTDADTTVEMRLYPEEATLHVWVAQCDLHRIPEFNVTIDYADLLAHRRIVPHLTQFPTYLRPRSIEPAEVQCIVIR